MKTFNWLSLDKNWNQQEIKKYFFFINTAIGWIQQFQKRKHLTSGKINGNGWRPRTAAANAIINSSDNYTTLALKDYSIRKLR